MARNSSKIRNTRSGIYGNVKKGYLENEITVQLFSRNAFIVKSKPYPRKANRC
jgi:hypothetical protein